jgi:uncharacterized protein (DUF2236 family)
VVPIVARRLNGERISVLAWPRAILMQMAHPLIAAGVARHSTFRGGAGSAAKRAHGTISAMLALTFGDAAAREHTLEHIRSIHRRVNGTLPEAAGSFPAGTVYSAENPELLLWVHATLLDSIPDIYAKVIGPLSPADLDAFCRESAPTLVALGGDPTRAPQTWSELQRYVSAMLDSGVLQVSREGHEIAEAVLTPRIAGVAAPGTAMHRLLTIGLLPPVLRQRYGFQWTERDQRRYERLLRIVRGARRFTPGVLARFRAAS